MIKLKDALKNLGLTQEFYNDLEADVQSDNILAQTGLIQSTKEDVEDEVEQLDTTEDARDENDESEVDMNILSPTMKAVYK
jgi:hypothetical protein